MKHNLMGVPFCLLLLISIVPSAFAQTAPSIVVTDSMATFWFPVRGTESPWQFGGTPESLCATVSIPLFGERYELLFCSGLPNRRVEAFDRVILSGGGSLQLPDHLAHAAKIKSSGVGAVPRPKGFELRLTDPFWVRMIAGARPDSLEMQLDFRLVEVQYHDPNNADNNANEWKHLIKVDYRLTPRAMENVAAAYRARNSAIQHERLRVYPVRHMKQALVSFANDGDVQFFDLRGKHMSGSEMQSLLPLVFLSTLASEKMTSFSLCGEHLVYADVSLFDVTAQSGVVDTLMEGVEGAHEGLYYNDVVLDPTGRYLAVAGGNGSGWGFLWDIDHHRSVSELYAEPSTWSADGSGVSQGDAWFPVNSSRPRLWFGNEDFASECPALNNGYVYWTTATSLRARKLTTKDAFEIASIPPFQDTEPFFDRTRVIGFVGDEVFVRVGSQVLVCNNHGVTRRFDAGPKYAHSRVSLQYIFAPR